MAASTGKITGVHIWLIIFVIAWLVFTVLWYLGFKERTELVNKAQAASNTAANSETALRTRLEEIQALIKLIGHEFDVNNIGVGELDNKTKVLGAMMDDIRTYGGNLAQENYASTIVSLRTELDSVTQARDQIQQQSEDLRRQLLALQNAHNARVASFQDQTSKSQSDLQDRVRTYEEMISSKDGEISQLRTNYQEKVLESETEREANAILMKEKNEEISRLTFINTKLQERIDKIEQISFERPDGKITNVDNSTRLVWINLGRRDNLTPQTTFSVYDRFNKGVARTSEDIKAQIEVTRVWEDRAEARILKADLYRPISSGDVIYSPIWEAGRVFNFSFVGFLDLDGDGIYDRELLRDIVTAAGAEIDNEVGDDGEWVVRKGVSVNTKFVIIGEIPDASQTERDDEKEIFEKIAEKRTELVNEARQQGVRVLSLNDFLAQIGYKPQRRLYIPGLSDKEYTLKAGSQSTGVNETIEKRSSSGRVSEIFGNTGTLGRPSNQSGY